MPFEFTATALEGVVKVTPRRFSDDRGWFAESYKQSEFAAAGISASFVQDNHSFSYTGVVRGLHYQLPPHGQGKLVGVIAGCIWDVAVDIRRSSSNFCRWVGVELSASSGEMLWIPEGFAHGFVSLEEGTHVAYKCTAEYNPDSERSLLWNDPDIAIEWPELSLDQEYRLSPKDAAAPSRAAAELYP